MSDHVKFEGWLTLRERDARKKKLMMEGFVKSIRDILDPLKPIGDIETDIAAAQALKLDELMNEYKDIQKEIEKAKKELGRA